MAVFYRGAGVDTYWHQHDARKSGFVARKPGGARDLDAILGHIRLGTTVSPYISMSRSYGVAWSYAKYLGLKPPTKRKPGFIYEIHLSDPLPPGLMVLDPVREVINSTTQPTGPGPHYQHDGEQDFLLWVVDSKAHAAVIDKPAKSPFGGATVRPPVLSAELETIVRALRDAELLVVGAIPQTCVVERHRVY